MGVERDPIVAMLAEANLAVLAAGEGSRETAEVRVADAAEVAVERLAAWHIDPDRRPQGRRTTQVEYYQPPLAVLERLRQAAPGAAMKLAPAAAVPEAWAHEAELEWISRDRQCRQLVAWFGPLTHVAGQRRATIVASRLDRPLVVRTLLGSDEGPPPVAEEIGRYVFDPDAAVLAARLLGTLAAEHRLAAADPSAAYLTGDARLSDPALACFEVTDVLPFDLRRLRQLVRSRGIGQLEVKKRGVRHDPEQVRRQLGPGGGNAAVLLIASVGKQVTAILGRRVVGGETFD